MLSDPTSEEYARFICKEERLGAAPGRPTSFKYCAGKIQSIRDLRLQQMSQGLFTAREVPGQRGLSSGGVASAVVWADPTWPVFTAVQVANPWSLETVSLYMSSKYNLEKQLLVRTALTVYLRKRMTHAQLLRAMRLCLDPLHVSSSWGITLRCAMAYMCSSARRTGDMRHLTFSSCCAEPVRQTTDEEPWVGRGHHVNAGVVGC